MSKIFISYRRDDSAATCGRIYERLAAHFGRDAVFKDVDDIPCGVRFPDYLAEQLRACCVELVIIGKYWLTLTTPDGIRRLDAPGDFVRTEVESGLRGGLIVVPVLVDNATMPRRDDLPESIRELIEFNGAEIHYDPYFDTDMQRLIRQLERWLGSTPPVASPTGTASPAAAAPTSQDDPATARIRQAAPLIESAFAAKDWSQVRDRCRYLTLDPATAKAMPARLWLLSGLASLEDGEPQNARAALEHALQQTPDNLETLRAAARACHQLRDDAAAETYLLRALGGPVTTTAERLAVLRDYLPVLVKRKNWNEALRRATEGGRLAPDDATWARWQLNAHEQLNHPAADALAAARTLTALSGATAGDWIARARLAYADANDTTTDEVRAALDAAARLVPAADPTLAAARRELLPPPPLQRVTLPPDRLPAKLIELGFAAYEQGGAAFILPPLCDVPAGPFTMGSDPKRDPHAQAAEQPAHDVNLPAFQIARYPVTVAEYACFVRAGHAEPQVGYLGADWRTQLTRLDHPVTCLSWHDATAYAAWLAARTGQPIRLPTEAEWEKAARWDAARRVARLYPWGDTFDKARCNTSESGIKTTTPVYAYPTGASPCGALDMAGNVWEWTSTLYKPYPYSQHDGREDQDSTDNRVLRGGSWGSGARLARAACRDRGRPVLVLGFSGFRLAVGPVRDDSRGPASKLALT